MIRFCCENCGCKIKAPETNTGKKGKCPKCGNALIVPEEININDLLVKNTQIKDNPVEPQPENDIPIEENESAGHRRLPWFIDIFLYPTSAPGLTNLAIFSIIPLITRILFIPGFILNFLIGFYFGWYLTECVRDSAKGKTRAPEAFVIADAREMLDQIEHIIGSYLIFIMPAFLYSLYAQKTDLIYWVLLTTGSFFFPMSLLACIMFDSTKGLNPILLLGSIFSTFFQYCLLVLLVIGIIFSFISITKITETENTRNFSITMLAFEGIFIFLETYIALIIAHLIGWFYWRNKEKLNWEC
jgi:hypothetical protein